MITLFSDLDNTLIFSHRVPLKDDRVLAEYLNGREQSFMPQATYRILKKYERRIRLVPITARSEKQYRRIFLLNGESHDFYCPCAIVCNGGVLLKNGERDEEWLAESMRISQPADGEMQRAYALMTTECAAEKIHFPESFFLYAVSDNPKKLFLKMKKELNPQRVTVGCDHRKVYVVAAGIHKGAAVGRFRKRFRTERIVTAGDSEFDLTMSEYGEPAILPAGLVGGLYNRNIIAVQSGLDEGFAPALENAVEL